MSDHASIGHMVNRAARLLRTLADHRLEPLGLSSGQLPVLTALLANENMSQKSLTEQAGIEQPTMAATLNRMERDAIIERQSDPHDKRSSLFCLTPATRNKAEAIKVVIESINLDSLAGLPTEERARLRQSLRSVISSVEVCLMSKRRTSTDG